MMRVIHGIADLTGCPGDCSGILIPSPKILHPEIKYSINDKVRTCEEDSNSRTFQGHSRPCIIKFKD